MPLKPGSEASIAPEWIRSSYSTDEGPDCVEVAAHPDRILVRDSKNPDGPHLALAPTAWAAFLPSV
ncbi:MULTISPECIES: DUF397 domain-containing protein [unclassified Streptomyces]|uniref:DUF397 domain-containing protein n=1 Tax=unclassified Streptomyces TaxID=2593676 RepID=UPI00224F8FF1|nr:MULTISPECIES: DUF397 domain-containing protein [unclassified Streptomyces]MCX4989323.1 DUF397 domain-containing protein [Streptomyces sp. NBC_00568]MCX5005455.1 DUF397 domain-containing protein [Streptomyces sp. NBC_00638]